MSQLSDSEIRKTIKERIKQWLEENEEWRVRCIGKGTDMDSPHLDNLFYAERQGKNNVMQYGDDVVLGVIHSDFLFLESLMVNLVKREQNLDNAGWHKANRTFLTLDEFRA